MDIASELRRSAYHVASIIFVLALYCMLTGTEAAAALLGTTGVAILAALITTGDHLSQLCPPHREAIRAGYSDADDLEEEHEW